MLEDIYCGTENIEGKYLDNFSPEEIVVFLQHIKKQRRHMSEYQQKLDALIAEDSPAIFANFLTTPNSALDIKYVLNRIAANDPRDPALELSALDAVDNPDRLALDIAKAFHNNTVCTTVILQDLGLTANGIEPLLRAFHHKHLSKLDISGNKIGESLPTLIHILDDPNTHWEEVRLGKIHPDPEQKEALEKHQNVSFVAVTPLTTKIRDMFTPTLE
ncbi:MAG: hypothetical protein J6Y85_03420 [Alphaproteobacteria bacterium]|nr:hypothetical protein [Alphaproteobacteria bacterium]